MMNTQLSDELRTAEARFYAALRRLHDDPQALAVLLGLWSQQDDVSTMNARGGVEQGAQAVRDRWTWWAAQQNPMQADPLEQLQVTVSDQLAYTLNLETHSDRTLRVTHVWRREQGGWRLVHRHADPLAARRD